MDALKRAKTNREIGGEAFDNGYRETGLFHVALAQVDAMLAVAERLDKIIQRLDDPSRPTCTDKTS